jgi:hypothetical protein
VRIWRVISSEDGDGVELEFLIAKSKNSNALSPLECDANNRTRTLCMKEEEIVVDGGK